MENYIADMKIIKGLFITIDPEKIKTNCEYFEINMSNSPSKISKRNNISILTLGFENNQFIQFQVKWNLNIKELNKLDYDYITNEIKSMILEAYKLTQIKTIENIF
ncbi:MAG: hypothetical protein A3F91_11245 [Flavobacteria bacterium RIFCSPLOWO2_12_FULL_35_11]|nr:MAG: hypothetical protein A3F91_11245 [Flavobacteria bacterium RIFCSPLOWO2_12_FULL_35_11]